VADTYWKYVLETAAPTEAEFCIKFLVRQQRISEIPELREIKEFMFAKRAAYLDGRGLTLGQYDGPAGQYIRKAIANVGPFSMIDKAEVTNHNDDGARAAEMSPEERKQYLEERGWYRK
jgi:hypothetical protein